MKKKDEQLHQLHREVSNLTFDKTKLHDLVLNLISCRWFFPSYPMFLWERYYLFELRAVYENKSSMGSLTCTFLEILCFCDFDDQNLLHEFFLHNTMCEHVSMRMVASFLSSMGYLQLQAFLSFMRNQIERKLAKKTTETNEEKITLWVMVESGMAYKLQQELRQFLRSP